MSSLHVITGQDGKYNLLTNELITQFLPKIYLCLIAEHSLNQQD